MRVAAIDVGTNTVLCTIADLDGGSPRVVVEHASIPRLGAGVDRTRVLSREAHDRTLACLRGLAQLCREHAVERTLAVGTSALRDAGGGADFVRDATEALSAELVVLDGEEEARLTFSGATWELPIQGPVCVVDIGGGSTEIVEGRIDGDTARIQRAVSLDIGSVRLFERHVLHDPPDAAELERVRQTVREALESVSAPNAGTLIGVAGTVTTLVALGGVTENVHGASLSRSDVERLRKELAAMTREERLQLTALEPGRADVIPVGALILGEILGWRGVEGLVASDHGVRWGVLRDEALRIGLSETK
jgi:exopolyphosphatase / guanosine-5'-triphosphate,3'-diphosphate pyrophosphatase